jgi:hypothetical protein
MFSLSVDELTQKVIDIFEQTHTNTQKYKRIYPIFKYLPTLKVVKNVDL